MHRCTADLARRSEEPGYVVGGEVKRRVRERVIRHEEQRHHDEQQRPGPVGCQRCAAHRREPFAFFPHSSSSPSAVASLSSSNSLEKLL